MMRKVFSVALVAALFGLVQSANAGVTIDVVFQDGTAPTGITIYTPGAWSTGLLDQTGPGCAFGGYAGGSVSTGYCMDVIIDSGTWNMTAIGTSVSYDSDNGLAITAIREWQGGIVSWGARAPSIVCSPPGGVTDTGSTLESFDCIMPAGPPPSPELLAGTYRLGTIIWDASATTPGSETIAAVINDLFNGVGAVINGNVVLLTSADITVGTHILNIVPEPGTASLLGLGLVGLILAGRRSRA